MKRCSLFIGFFLITLSVLQAQTVAGVYKGFMEVDSPKNTINFELTLKEKKGKLTGYCYRLFVLGDTLYYNLLKVNARISNDVLIVEDEYSVSNNFENNTRGIKTVFFFNLKDIRDTATVLPGKWNTSAWRNYKSLTGAVNVIREKDYLSTQLYKRLADKKLDQDMAFEEPATAPPVVVAQKEKNKTQSDNTAVVVNKTDKASGDKKEQATDVVANQKSKSGQNDVRTTDKKKDENKTAITEKEKETNASVLVQPSTEQKETKEKRNIPKGESQNKTTRAQPEPSQDKSVARESEPISPNKNTKQNDKNISATNNADSASLQQKELILAQNKDTTKQEYTGIKETISQAKIQTSALSRASDLIQTLSVYEDSITIALYDNGEIDGDTVSVYVNEKQILSKIGLGAKAQKFTIYVPAGQVVQVSLFAETLGTIPPNTGLMVVYTGDQRYQVFFTSTLEKSASVLFRRL